jgi:hypothetical protein
MYMLNGQITLGGQKFWRVDNLNKPREGMEMLQKPMMLLLVEDFTQEAVDALLKMMNELE